MTDEEIMLQGYARGYAQGLADRGPTPCEEIDIANAILNERELCAQACEELNNNECAAAIRARSA